MSALPNTLQVNSLYDVAMRCETGTSLSMCVLGSGSSGNCSVLELALDAGQQTILIDLGLSPRETATRLYVAGRRLDEIECALLTHLDQDHLHPGWPRTLERLGVRIFAHRRHVKGAAAMGVPVRQIEAFEDEFALGSQTRVRPVRLPHDELGAVGYVLEHDGARLGYATDLGRVTDELLAAFSDLDIVSLESNYCPRLQVESPRPAFLKRRIMGGLGHLSNEQSVAAVKQIASKSRLQHVVLLHLSRECNSAERVKEVWSREAPHLMERLTITEQSRATQWLSVKRPPKRWAIPETLFEMV